MRTILVFALAAVVVLCAGCGNRRSNTDNAPASHLHVPVPPHGGVPVALGDDYQIEWVLDASAGKLQAYVMDGEMENFVRIAPPSFDLTAQLPGRGEVLHLMAVANTATGEKVGSTCLFEAQADWLKTTNKFTAVLKQINVQGTIYSNIAFTLPKSTH
jgi:hypothetical protein